MDWYTLAPIIGAPAGVFFTLRHYRKLTTNPLLKFGNILEFVSRETVSEASANLLIDDWSTFYRNMSLLDSEMDRAVLSTWVEDGSPYDPTSFITRALVGVGLRTSLTDAMSLNNCLFIRKQTATGMNGKLFLRRYLTEGDTHSPSGTLALLDPTIAQDNLSDAILDSDVGKYLNGTGPFQMVMKSELLLEREVTSLAIEGARVMQFNNRYYDVP